MGMWYRLWGAVQISLPTWAPTSHVVLAAVRAPLPPTPSLQTPNKPPTNSPISYKLPTNSPLSPTNSLQNSPYLLQTPYATPYKLPTECPGLTSGLCGTDQVGGQVAASAGSACHADQLHVTPLLRPPLATPLLRRSLAALSCGPLLRPSRDSSHDLRVTTLRCSLSTHT